MDDKERFYRHFCAEIADIQAHIGQLETISAVGGERQDAKDALLARISTLSLEVADAADFIPAYDQRSYAQTVKDLTEQVNQELARLTPKPRFQFKRSAKTAAASSVAAKADDPRLLRGAMPAATPAATPAEAAAVLSSPPRKDYNAEVAQAGPGAVRRPSFSAAREVALSGHTGLHILLPLSASRATASGQLTDLAHCVVDMSLPTSRGPPTSRGQPTSSEGQTSSKGQPTSSEGQTSSKGQPTSSEGQTSSKGQPTSSEGQPTSTKGPAFLSLMLQNLDRCLVVAGHVDGPVHITGVRRSVLVMAARQVRIHECHDVDLYLYCRSRPIIEDCSGLRFAPIPEYYASKEDAPNQWDQVDDFKWLKADHSPNWSVLPEEQRLPETVWSTAVAGVAGQGTEDVLKAVGLGKR